MIILVFYYYKVTSNLIDSEHSDSKISNNFRSFGFMKRNILNNFHKKKIPYFIDSDFRCKFTT
ncbi:hypothetical protein HMPREF2660_01985 [Weeksella sp. HMSC059D05]|nr:hypothetical protein HMPREF2660_01985 [Weeksella sp. HMSC059D05]